MGALDTGVSGLRAHQHQLDVVANNLANMNTVGFKSQATTFSDLTYETIRAGAGAGEDAGSINPQQVGSGVAIGQISRNFSQGSLEATGELLDFAIQGEGFFVVDGTNGQDLFTRAGSFTLDERGDLVDPATGYRVQRIGTVGEATEDKFGFQEAGDRRINIPLGSAIPGSQTRTIDFFGSLPTSGKPPTSEVLSSSQPYETDTGPAELTTLLNDLTINTVDYVAGDTIELNGTNPDGTPFSATLAAETATMQDLIDEINGAIEGAVAELLPNGTLNITATETGDAFSSLTIQNAAGNVGSTDFINTSMIVSNEGSDGDKYDVSLDVYDKRGNANRVSFQFAKLSDNGWNLTATLDSGDGTFLDAQVNNIFFNEDGTYSIAGEEGVGDTNVELKFDSIAEQQVIQLSFDNMTHIATDYSTSLLQDGTPTGTLVSVAVGGDGLLSGLSSNGEVVELAQLAIARFSNVEGLDGLGGNFFGASVNSGTASIGSGLTSGRGSVIGNQLEGSNVDLAQEFTRLIVAQRGFSANARTITVADEVLEELTNIIR